MHIDHLIVSEQALLGGREGTYPIIRESLNENRVGVSANAVGMARAAALWKRLPSNVLRNPKAASHNPVARSSIASKTGARSPGEELMTCKTWVVAVSR